MADLSYPCRARTYRNHLLDSTRWDRFLPRAGDLLISTSHKSGTTWMQRIVSLLVFGPGPLPAPLSHLAPWVDARLPSLDRMIERLERQEHRRFVKSHLPLDALPYDPQVRYLWVARDTRDVFICLWNHYHSMTEATYEALSAGSIEVTEEAWPPLVAAARFDAMREEALREEAEGDRFNGDLKGGAATFFFKGTNGRWREVLSREDLALYEQAAARLDPGLRSWLEGGSLAAGDPQA